MGSLALILNKSHTIRRHTLRRITLENATSLLRALPKTLRGSSRRAWRRLSDASKTNTYHPSQCNPAEANAPHVCLSRE